MLFWWNLGIFLLLLCALCSADAVVDDLLRDSNGKSPCDLVQEITSNTECGSNASSDSNFPVTNKCTCSNGFFNLYSTCQISKLSYKTMFTAAEWSTQCASVTASKEDDEDEPAIVYPSWATTNIPEDQGYYDVMGLFASLEQDRQEREREREKESRAQLLALILLPVLGTVVLATVGLVGFYWYRNRNRLAHKRREASYKGKHLLGVAVPFTKPVVRRASTSDQWEIDRQSGPNANKDAQSLQDDEDDEVEEARPQHIRLRSTDSEIGKEKKVAWLPKVVASVTSRRRDPASTTKKGSSSYHNDRNVGGSSGRDIVYTALTDSTLANYRLGGFREPSADPSSFHTALMPLRSRPQSPPRSPEEERDEWKHSNELLAPAQGDAADYQRNASSSVMLISRADRDDFTIESGNTPSTQHFPQAVDGSSLEPELLRRDLSRENSYQTNPSASSSRSASIRPTNPQPYTSENNQENSYGMRTFGSDFSVTTLPTPPPPWHEAVRGRPLPIPGLSPPYRHSPANDVHHDSYSRPPAPNASDSFSHRYPVNFTSYPPARQGP